MPMLLVFTAAAATMALILSATVVIAVDATSAQTAVACKDKQNFILRPTNSYNINNISNKAKPQKDCDWVGKKKKRRKKLCKKNKRVIAACPETCGFCSDNNESFKTECPKKFTSRKFSRKGGDCSDYKKGLECDYNFQFFYGCSSSDLCSDSDSDSDSDSNDLQCYPADTYTCNNNSSNNNNVWQLSSFVPLPCVGPPPSKDLPIGEACDPTKDNTDKDDEDEDTDCPLVEPDNQSDCSDAQVNLDCNYGFMYTGCTLEDAKCSPTRSVTCTNDRKWQTASSTSTSITSIPEQCQVPPPKGLPIGEVCDPTDCPLGQPENQSDCSGFQDNLECGYRFKYNFNKGCTLDDMQCLPTIYYTCNKEDNDNDNDTNKYKWQLILQSNIPLPSPPCQVPPSITDLLPIDKECDPNACPLGEPTAKSTCRESQVGLDCTYNFQYTGCSYVDGLICIPLTTYSCLEEELDQEQDQQETTTFSWELPTLIPLPCVDPGKGLPMGGTKQCDVCPTVEPADQCPVKEPTSGGDCSDFIVVKGTPLDCMYNFRYAGCSEDELHCTPGNMYTCFPEDGTWQEYHYSAEFCPRGCPQFKPTGLGHCVADGYEDGLECEYDFRFTGCTDADQKCSPMEFYECTKKNGWVLATVDQMNCSEPVPDGFGQSCSP